MTDIAKALDESDHCRCGRVLCRPAATQSSTRLHLRESKPAIIQLVELGDPHRNIPPCAACHRAGAGGPIEAPVLAEQGDEYLIQQLKLYASGQRRNDVYGRMRLIASRLTEDEIKGLAAYYRAGFR